MELYILLKVYLCDLLWIQHIHLYIHELWILYLLQLLDLVKPVIFLRMLLHLQLLYLLCNRFPNWHSLALSDFSKCYWFYSICFVVSSCNRVAIYISTNQYWLNFYVLHLVHLLFFILIYFLSFLYNGIILYFNWYVKERSAWKSLFLTVLI